MLFDSPRLNEGILFKGIPTTPPGEVAEAAHGHAPSLTIFLPLHSERPEDGGCSYLYSAASHAEASCRRWLMQQQAAASEQDFTKLTVLRQTPTFCPPVLNLAFRRAGITVPHCYGQIPDDRCATLADHLRARLRSILVATAEGATGNVEQRVEQVVAMLLLPATATRLGNNPLARALKLPSRAGWDILSAWIGLTIYECESAALKHRTREFLAWIKSTVPHEGLRWDDRDLIRSIARAVSQQTCDIWVALVKLFAELGQAHEALVFNGEKELFTHFLWHSPGYFCRAGDLLGRLEQCIYFRKDVLRSHRGRPLPHFALYELLTTLRFLLDLNGTAKSGDSTVKNFATAS